MLGALGTAFCLTFTLIMSEAAVASSLLDRSGDTTRRFARFWGTTLCRTCGIRVAARGGERVDWERPLIVMANHQSYVDIPVLYAALPVPFGMLAKRELFRLPLFSAAMRSMRCVSIDRNNRRQSFESLRQAAEQVQHGSSIVIFPEGTRNALPKDGVLVHSAEVDVTIGDPIDPDKKGHGGRDRLRAEVHAALVELSGLPAAPAQGEVLDDARG